MEMLLKNKKKTNHVENISLPWVEKYRPKNTSSILLNKNLRNKINTILNNESVGNLILTGEPGTGKTSTILCIINQLYNDVEKERLLNEYEELEKEIFAFVC